MPACLPTCHWSKAATNARRRAVRGPWSGGATGKTIQVIGLLAHLKEREDKGPILIGAPLSTVRLRPSARRRHCMPRTPLLHNAGTQVTRAQCTCVLHVGGLVLVRLGAAARELDARARQMDAADQGPCRCDTVRRCTSPLHPSFRTARHQDPPHTTTSARQSHQSSIHHQHSAVRPSDHPTIRPSDRPQFVHPTLLLIQAVKYHASKGVRAQMLAGPTTLPSGVEVDMSLENQQEADFPIVVTSFDIIMNGP